MERSFYGVFNYIYAEYNPVWIYMGWWLYAAPIRNEPVHGRVDWPDHEQAVWLRYDWRLDALMKALGLPELHDYRGDGHTKSIVNFMEHYPIGVVCQVDDGGRKFEILKTEVLWEYAKIMREAQLLKWAEASGKHQDEIEELRKQLLLAGPTRDGSS
jgi:hypothetical protein